jgi:hypothetical protein
MMLLGFLARSFKEGQTYLTPIYLLAVLPALVTASPDAALTAASQSRSSFVAISGPTSSASGGMSDAATVRRLSSFGSGGGTVSVLSACSLPW